MIYAVIELSDGLSQSLLASLRAPYWGQWSNGPLFAPGPEAEEVLSGALKIAECSVVKRRSYESLEQSVPFSVHISHTTEVLTPRKMNTVIFFIQVLWLFPHNVIQQLMRFKQSQSLGKMPEGTVNQSIETIRSSAFLGSVRILGRVFETWETQSPAKDTR